jgi:hypothetical protein
MIRRSLPFAVAVAALAPLSAWGEVSIDTFSTPQAVEAPLGGPDSALSVVTAPEAIGGERDVQVLRESGGAAVQFQTSFGGQEVLSCSAGAATEGSCLVIWDGDDGVFPLDPTGLGGIDLTEGGQNDVVALAARSDLPVSLDIQVTRASDGSFVSAILDLPGGDTGFVERAVPIAAFGASDPTPVFSDAGAITVLISGAPAFDVLVDDVRVTVPEPGAAGGALAAAGALAALSRRRSR